MQRGLAVALGMLAAGCAAPGPRANWQLTGGLGIVASNSRVLSGNAQPERKGDTLLVRHPVVFSNLGRHLASIGFGHARASVGSVEVRLLCETAGEPRRVVYVQPGERGRADCVASLDPAVRARIGHQDRQLSIRIPVRSITGQSELTFSYQLWLDDLS